MRDYKKMRREHNKEVLIVYSPLILLGIIGIISAIINTYFPGIIDIIDKYIFAINAHLPH